MGKRKKIPKLTWNIRKKTHSNSIARIDKAGVSALVSNSNQAFEDGNSVKSTDKVPKLCIEQASSAKNVRKAPAASLNSENYESVACEAKDCTEIKMSNVEMMEDMRVEAELKDAIMTNVDEKPKAAKSELPVHCIYDEPTKFQVEKVGPPIRKTKLPLVDDIGKGSYTDVIQSNEIAEKVDVPSKDEHCEIVINQNNPSCKENYKHKSNDNKTWVDPLDSCNKEILELQQKTPDNTNTTITTCGEDIKYPDSYYLRSNKDSAETHKKIKEEPSTVLTPHTEVTLTKNIKRGELLDCIHVKFHTVVPADVYQMMIEEKAYLYIVFGRPVSDWTSYSVQLEVNTTSHFANSKKIGYVTGELELSRDHLNKNIPYKYVLFQTKDIYECLFTDYTHQDLNRVLTIRTELKHFNKYDEPLVFNAEGKVISISDSVLVFASTVDSKYILKEGISAALRIKETIFNTFEKDLNYLYAHSGKEKSYSNAYNRIDYTRLSYLRVPELERQIFSNIWATFKHHLDMVELPQNIFMLAAYLLIYVESSSITMDSLDVIKPVFITLAKILPQVIKEKRISYVLKSVDLKLMMKKALVNTANRFFYLIDCLNVLPPKEKLDNCCAWLAILPYIEMLDEKVKSKEVMLRNINVKLWKTLAIKHDFELIHFLQHSNMLTSHLVKEAVVVAVADAEMIKLFRNPQSQWIVDLPFYPIALAFFEILSKKAFNEQWFTQGSFHLLTRLQMLLTSPESENPEIERFTCKHLMHLFDVVKYKYSKLILIINLLLQMLEAFSDSNAVSAKEIAINGEILIHKSCDCLRTEPVRHQWKHWVDLYIYARKFQLTHLVERLFKERLAYCTLGDCVDSYSSWEDESCHEMLDIVVNKTVELLRNDISIERDSIVTKVCSSIRGFLASPKAITFFSHFLSKTFQNEISLKSIMALCQRPDVEIFSIMVELKKELPRDIQFTLNLINNKLYALTKSLNRGKFSVLEFQEVFGFEVNHFALKNINKLQSCVGKLLKKNSLYIDPHLFDNFQKKVKEFTTTSKILLNLIPTIKDDQTSFINENHLPKIPHSSEVMLSELDYGYLDVFKISNEELGTLEWFERHHCQSNIFPKLWKDAMQHEVNEINQSKGTIEEVEIQCDAEADEEQNHPRRLSLDWQSYKSCLLAARTRIQNLLGDFNNKTISIDALENLMENVKDRELETEFQILGITSIIPQAQFLLQIQTVKAAVMAFENMLKVLGRPGFKDVDLIKAGFGDETFKDKKVSELSDATINQGKLFETFEPEDVELLESFGKCGNFVHWIQEHIKSNQEFKVFLDLASISAGESDIDLERLMIFRASVTGFAPLFFDINRKSTLDEVMNALETVFKNRSTNVLLHENIIETNRHLPWIKDIQDRHGSVEASSLTTVEHINNSGSFTIRCKGDGGNRWKEPLKAITMYLKISEDKRAMEHFELDELRSKLMLITVKEEGELAVDRYTRVLDNIEIIAKKLSSLLDAGCHLFSELKLDGYFNMNKKVTLRVDFGHRSGTVNCNIPLIQGLQQIISFLQKVGESWNKEINEMREMHNSLNYFTTEQLVVLSAAFAELIHSKQQPAELSLEAAMLIKSVCPTISLTNVKDRVMTAYNQSSSMNLKEDGHPPPIAKHNGAYIGECGDKIDFTSHPKFNQILTESAAEQEVVIACLAYYVGEEKNIEDLVNWCIDHEDDNEADLKTIVDKAIVELKSLDIQSADSAKEAIAPVCADLQRVKFDTENHSNSANSNLEECLYATWSSFQEQNNDELKAKDYIPLHILALCLENVVSRYMSKPQRAFPRYLTKGRPNLLICPPKDVHKIALMIFQADEKKPNPTLPEVLICSKKTTKEQVDLLCRRAFKDDSGKIFVVLHAHLLSFEIVTHAENLFTMQSSLEYKIVFLSSAEGKIQSYINTAFEDALVSAPLPPLDCVLKDYLKHYQKSKASEIAAKEHHPDPDCYPVRLVTSEEYGNGKSLLINEVSHKADRTIHLHLDEHEVDVSDIIDCWSRDWNWSQCQTCYSLFHLDATLTTDMQRNDLLFSLAVLGGLANESAKLWVLSNSEVVMAELTSTKVKSKGHCPFYKMLPSISCKSPQDVVQFLETVSVGNADKLDSALNIVKTNNDWIYLMNEKVYMSDVIQRPYQYLALSSDSQKLDSFTFAGSQPLDKVLDCLRCLLNSCPIKVPTWVELIHFSSFLNVQLKATEKSVFCDASVLGDSLRGFKSFVVHFLIQMAQDFATRSVRVSDESHGEGFMVPIIEERRQWEHSPHPYIFFNNDTTLSFFGFFIDHNRNLVDEKTKKVIKPNFISGRLYQDLCTQGVVFNTHFSSQTRKEKLARLCTVIGSSVTDPDPRYELTYDNVMKILATTMRFRSNIPVVMMGETGSGKTTLVKFMCALHRGKTNLQNMIVMKIHGGVTKKSICRQVNQAIEIAKRNIREGVMQTVLFFDEANTTSAISTIKTVMCDRLVDGKPIPNDIGLQFVAAVNPYRKHSADMICKLEDAGLGYHIQADQTLDKLGSIPMRRLVYRVREIPQSMFPLIWDFGTLDACTERLYIKQMVEKWLPENCFDVQNSNKVLHIIIGVLCFSQQYMRLEKDECFFVSLRDVDRTLKVLRWFCQKHADILDKFKFTRSEQAKLSAIPGIVLNVILAIGVTYYVRLQDRLSFAEKIADFFQQNMYSINKKLFSDLIEKCQDLFLEELQLENNIAPNTALKENVWMMTLCIELQIPLFLVGKPGSSKSLAKTVVSDVMQGEQSYSQFFKNLKEIQMISFQCSPIATANGILGTFKQSQKFQKERDLSKFSAVVVLDEIGLAEDSEKMPLKALHPLLEDGCIDEEPKDYMKVSFIGISNWALDPAKMNRGIFVSRGVPSKWDLELSAEGICKNDSKAYKLMRQTIKILTKGYFALYGKQEREYFGLRDFYSLIKNVFNVAKQGRVPTDNDIVEAVQRNFGGFFGDFDPVDYFLKEVDIFVQPDRRIQSDKLIFEALRGNGTDQSRYILLLTKNNAALHILQEKENLLDHSKTHVMFGSSFPQDKEYTSICYNINKVKIAMELGHTVILCNLNNLYESLYDALNQNYVSLGGKRYVDLGLGTHRVKCRVHEEFRLILIADDEEVHKKFPIPLINRLEKHYLSMETILDLNMQNLVRSLEEWVDRFCELTTQKRHFNFGAGDVFIGYHGDIISAIILRLQEEGVRSQTELEEKAKKILLSCAAPDGIMRLSYSTLPPEEQSEISQVYYLEQHHTSLGNFLKHCPKEKRLLQVTTSSRLLTATGRLELEKSLGLSPGSASLLTLQQFESRLAFEKRLKDFITEGQQLLIIQSDVSSSESIKLIECARFVAQGMMGKAEVSTAAKIVFVIHVQRVAGGIFPGMSVYPWLSFHIDELREQRQHDINIEAINLELSIASALEKNLLSIKELVIDTVPKAASFVRTDPSRVQRRIDVLLEALKSNDSDLLQIVCKSITDQLKLSKLKNLKTWLLGIAMDSTHMKEGNTYQRSVWLHLQEQIVIPLRICIETLDIDQGLELLLNNDRLLVQLYLKFFSFIECNATAAASWYRGCFPFSRLISDELEQLYKVAHASCFLLHCAFEDSKLSEPLLYCFSECNEAVPRFILDLVQLNFDTSAISIQAQNILCEEIHFIAKRFYQGRLEKSKREDENDKGARWGILSPVDVFFAIKTLKPRLVFLHKLLMFDNRLCDVAAQMIDKRKTVLFRTDILLFQKLLMFNAAKPKELSKSEDIEKWCLQISKLVSLYNTLISLDTKDELMPVLQALLNQLSIIKLFLHHVSKSNFRPTEPMLKRLVRRLDNNTLKEKEGFDKFVKVLLLANKESIEFHFASAGIDGCILCEEVFDRPGVKPVTLPCSKKHVGCKSCLEDHFRKKEGEWTCPSMGCGEEIAKTFDFKSTLECQKNVAGHKQYKNQLQFFFLDVLQLYVFANEPPSPEVTDQVMSYVVTTKLDETKTKTISPFANHGIDAAPVIRSFLLQLLLQDNNFASATRALKKFLNQKDDLKLDNIQFCELRLLSVYCLEDRLLQEQTLSCFGRKTVLDMDCCMQLLLNQEKNLNVDTRDNLEVLLDVATMRLCVLSLAPILHNLVTIENNGSEKEQHLLMAVASRVICKYNKEWQENMKSFLVRVLINLYSRGFIKEWLQSAIYLELMPSIIRETASINPTDNFFICSEYYGKVRQHLRAALMGNFTELNEIITEGANIKTEWDLALYFLCRIEGVKVVDAKVFVEEVNKRNDQRLGEITKTMLQSDDRHWFGLKLRTEMQIRIVSFLHYLKIGLDALSSPNYIQYALQCICTQRFFPTMKQDDSIEVMSALKTDGNGNRDVTRVYRCPNCQTPFGIGDCGHPVAYQGGQGKCPHCNNTVGGAAYNQFLGTGKTSEETGETKLVDATQPGHILGAVNGFEKAEAERELCSKEVAITQFLVHAAMTLDLPQQSVLVKCIHPQPQEPLPAFLLKHLENNFEQICQSLGKSNDDVMILLFHVAKRLCDLCPSLSHHEANLQSKKSRQIWENEFARHVIRPELESLESNVELLFVRMRKEKTAADEALARVLSPSSENHGDSRESSLPEASHFWFTRTQVNVSSLQHSVNHINAKCPNLFRLLADKKILKELCNLPSLLQLQFKLRKLFNKKIESHMVDDVSVERFLVESALVKSDHSLLLDLVKSYFVTFNKLQHDVFANGQIGKSARAYLKGKDLNLKSAAGVLFASEHSAGQCFNALVDCLVVKHNLLMDAYFSEAVEEQYLPEPSRLSEDMSPNQLVTYNEKDLNLMLVMHSDYTLQIEGKRGMKWKLNEEALEQNVVKRSFVGRAKFRIDTLPKFQFRNDDVVLLPLREKIHQEAISLKVKGQIRKELIELRDVGNVLDCLQTTLTILQQTADSKPEDYLTTKMKQLHLYPVHGGAALRGLKLMHTDACFGFLTLLRARWMLKHKHDPFNLIESNYHETLPCNISKSLKPLVDHPKIDQILFQLHLFIHIRLKKTLTGMKENIGMDSPEGILREYFGAFMESIDDNEANEHAELFDRQILNCHAISVFIELLERHLSM